MESRNLAVELLEKLLLDEIKVRACNNVVVSGHGFGYWKLFGGKRHATR